MANLPFGSRAPLILTALAALFFFGLNSLPEPYRERAFLVMGVNSQPIPYGDTATVLSWIECRNKGVDTYRENPCAPAPLIPWKSNYGEVVYILASLVAFSGKALTTADTHWIGTTTAILFFLCAWVTFPGWRIWHSVYWTALLVSPVSLLALERGNLELLLASLLGIAFLTRFGRWPYVSEFLILFCSLFKFFPIAALAGLVNNSRKAFLSIGVTSALFFLYMYFYLDKVKFILANGPTQMWNPPFGFLALKPAVLGYGITYIIFGIMIGWITIHFLRSEIPVLPFSPAAAAFLAGSGIFVVTVVMNTGFFYRFCYIVLLVPLLFELQKRKIAVLRSRWALLLIAILFYSARFSDSVWVSLVRKLSIWGLTGIVFSVLLLWLPHFLPQALRQRLRIAPEPV